MANEKEKGSIADHTPIVLEDDCGTKINVEALGKIMTEKLRRDSPLSAECCIFRVPKVLRRHNPKAYAPDVVSIGPFHRRGKQFQPMENVKQWYLHNFISDLGIDMKTLIDKIDNISKFEKQAREFYAEPLDHLSENKLIEMMILDGCFLLELFRKIYESENSTSETENSTSETEYSTPLPAKQESCSAALSLPFLGSADLSLLFLGSADLSLPLLGSARSIPVSETVVCTSALSLPEDRGANIINDPMLNMACMRQYLLHDLLLLENQLPWFVLEHLYSLAVAGGKYPLEPSLNVLVLKFFHPIEELSCNFNSYFKDLEKKPAAGDAKILHILDLARSAIVFQFGKREELPATCLSKAWVKFTTAIVSQFRKPEDEPHREKPEDEKEYSEVFKLPPATSLSEAGVKFRKSSVEGILNVKFVDGVFKIPKFGIGELTEPLFRNLVAFEQCYHGRPHQITSYVFLMDNLINSSKDIDLLCDKKIISNWLSSETASQLFNDLYDDTFLNQYFYDALCIEVNKYYNNPWHRWLEKLRRDYFGNPWTIISLIAAIILLLLTILQTAYTILAYYFPR